MANLGEYLTELAKKAGIDIEDAKLKEVVTKVATQEIDDSIVTKLNASYMTTEAAKQNPDIKKHFTASVLNGLDTELDSILSDSEFSDDLRAQIKAEKSSYKRVPMLVKAVKELEAAKAGASKGDK